MNREFGRNERRKLSDRTLQTLKPAAPGARYVIWDTTDNFRGFGVRVTDRGHATFIVMRRPKNAAKPVRYRLGDYPGLTLATARIEARKALDDLARGEHPRERVTRVRAEEGRRKAEEAARAKNTFGAVAEEFIRRYVYRRDPQRPDRVEMSSADLVAAGIRRDLISRWGDVPIADITGGDVLETLEEIATGKGKWRREDGSWAKRTEPAPGVARLTLGYARKVFAWAKARPKEFGLLKSPSLIWSERTFAPSSAPASRGSAS